MLSLMFDAVGCVLLGFISIHSIILHIRLARFRDALAEVGRVLPNFDSSVNQMAQMANGFTGKLLAELQTVEGRVAAARRLGIELGVANRAAAEATVQLGRLLRQHKQIDAVRASFLPREMVEPKGFAARAGLPPLQTAPDKAVQNSRAETAAVEGETTRAASDAATGEFATEPGLAQTGTTEATTDKTNATAKRAGRAKSARKSTRRPATARGTAAERSDSTADAELTS